MAVQILALHVFLIEHYMRGYWLGIMPRSIWVGVTTPPHCPARDSTSEATSQLHTQNPIQHFNPTHFTAAKCNFGPQ